MRSAGKRDQVVPAAKSNLAAAMAGKEIITFVARCNIREGEKLLLDYGDKYRIVEHQPIQLESQE